MDIGLKHILLFISIIVFGFVFYRVISSRLYNATHMVEGMNDGICKNNYADSDTLPLREYIIKSCYNSAYDPNENPRISVANLEKRIAEGYRFIDVNVFSSEGKLYVGYSPDNKPTLTDISIPFSEALDCIKKNAFTKSAMKINSDEPLWESKSTDTSASIRDTYVNYPLFVMIRIYRSEKSKLDIIEKIQEMLKTTADTRYYREGGDADEKAIQIDGCTPLSDIKGKILFVMDIANLLQIYTPIDKSSADQIPESTRKHLTKFVNIYAGGNIWRHGSSEKSMPLLISDLNQPYKTNLFLMQIKFPSVKETVNPDTHKLILENSIQTIVVRPYLADTNLRAYTKIFSDAKRPMVCGVHVYTYLNGISKK